VHGLEGNVSCVSQTKETLIFIQEIIREKCGTQFFPVLVPAVDALEPRFALGAISGPCL
jgi:hypothetical protein